MDKPTMLDALETGPEIEMMMLEWDSSAKNNLVSDDFFATLVMWPIRLNLGGQGNQFLLF